MGVERGDIEVDESHAIGGEDCPRGGREVAVASADPDDEVGLVGDRVGSRRPRRSDGTQRLRVVVGQRPLACLGFPDRDSRRLGECREAPRSPASRSLRHRRRSAAAARRPDQLDRARECGLLDRGSADVPDPLGEQLVRPVVGLGLHVLRQEIVTAPVSTGSVSTRIAASRLDGSCSGRLMRSQKRETGLNASLTLISMLRGSSISCSTGLATRVAKMSPGSSKTGIRLTVASAAPVIMLVEPGPTEAVTAYVAIRSRMPA